MQQGSQEPGKKHLGKTFAKEVVQEKSKELCQGKYKTNSKQLSKKYRGKVTTN